MIELIQVPWSPFCIVQRRILEYSQANFKTTNIPYGDRSLVWKLSKQRYYQIPIIRDGRQVVFELNDDTQVIAKYIDVKLQLGLFPPQYRGLQAMLWNYIESRIESVAFKLNDIYFEEFVPAGDQLDYLRHKERKFGPGCLDEWRERQEPMREELSRKLMPLEQMLEDRPFLMDHKPRFVDFDLYGVLANYLFAGHNKLPQAHTQLQTWYERMNTLTLSNIQA